MARGSIVIRPIELCRSFQMFKWTIRVMSHLAAAHGHRLRFSELKKGIEGITQRMLALTLRNLETRRPAGSSLFPGSAAARRVRADSDGTSMLPALESFTSWIRENWPRIEEGRRTCDDLRPRLTGRHDCSAQLCRDQAAQVHNPRHRLVLFHRVMTVASLLQRCRSVSVCSTRTRSLALQL